MDLTFASRVIPPKAVPIAAFRDATSEGEMCQVFVIFEFRDANNAPLLNDAGKPIRRRLVVHEGRLNEWVRDGWISVPESYSAEEHDGLSWTQFKLRQLYDSIPMAPQNILDAVEAAMPVQAVEELWNRG